MSGDQDRWLARLEALPRADQSNKHMPDAHRHVLAALIEKSRSGDGTTVEKLAADTGLSEQDTAAAIRAFHSVVADQSDALRLNAGHMAAAIDQIEATTFRDWVEGDYVSARAVELSIRPVQGQFDADHLLETHRQLFQDMPGTGLEGYNPGAFREGLQGDALQAGDWVKWRRLHTADISSPVAYSPMTKEVRNELAAFLQERAAPERLAAMDRAAFADEIAEIYTRLDYIHPFDDGNSRTLRTFTAQLAQESGYEIDWSRFNASPVGRDMLSVARDLSVNREALERGINSSENRRDVLAAVEQFSENTDLKEILRGAVSAREGNAVQNVLREVEIHGRGGKSIEDAAKRLEIYRALSRDMDQIATVVPEMTAHLSPADVQTAADEKVIETRINAAIDAAALSPGEAAQLLGDVAALLGEDITDSLEEGLIEGLDRFGHLDRQLKLAQRFLEAEVAAGEDRAEALQLVAIQTSALDRRADDTEATRDTGNESDIG